MWLKSSHLWALSTPTGTLSNTSCTLPNPFTSPQKGRSMVMDWEPAEHLLELKHLIMWPHILVQPDQDAHFWLETDASGYTTGEVLSQLCDNNKWHPIGFTSKSLTKAKRNYVITLGKQDNFPPWNTLGKSHKYIKYLINIISFKYIKFYRCFPSVETYLGNLMFSKSFQAWKMYGIHCVLAKNTWCFWWVLAKRIPY